jgi:CHAD domain-containing protein
MSNPIQEYYQKHSNLVAHYLMLSKDHNDVEAIHNMRLSIKRIRVVIRLVGLLNKDFNSDENIKQINFLFKRSGKLRDLQVIRQLFCEMNKAILKPMVETLNLRITKNRLKYDSALNHFDPRCLDRLGNDIEAATDHLSPKALIAEGQSLLSLLIDEIHELFHSRSDEKRLHSIRRKLKDINYLNNIFSEGLPVQESLNLSVDRLRELGEMAGSWHDRLIMEHELQHFIEHFPEKSHESMKTMFDEVVTIKEELFQEYTCILVNEIKV